MIKIPKGKIKVDRKGFTRGEHKRRAYTRKDGTKVKPTTVKSHSVKSSSFYITDRGAKGRGKKVIPKLQKGRMTELARKYGYITGDQTINDIPHSKMDDFTRDLVYKEGLSQKTVLGMYQAQIIFRKRDKTPEGKEFKKQMEAGRKELKDIPNLSDLQRKLDQEKKEYQELSKELRTVSALGMDIPKEVSEDLRNKLRESRKKQAELELTIREIKQKGTQIPPDVTVITPEGVATLKGSDFVQEKGAWIYKPQKKDRKS